jgi:hypothetical protein
MKKPWIATALLVACAAQADNVFFDDYSVTGGVNSDINAEIGTTRQLAGTTSTYTYRNDSVTGDTASIVDDFSNGGTLRVAATYGSGTGTKIGLDSDFGAQLAGTTWTNNFWAYTPVVAGTLNGGWFGFGVSSSGTSADAPFGEFGIIIRPTGGVTLFGDGGSFTGADAANYNSFSSIINYRMVVDEAAQTATVSYDAYDTSLNHLGSQTLATLSGLTFSNPDTRTLNYRIWADDAADATINGYLESNSIDTIPEPGTLGMLVLLGGGIMCFRRFFRV